MRLNLNFKKSAFTGHHLSLGALGAALILFAPTIIAAPTAGLTERDAISFDSGLDIVKRGGNSPNDATNPKKVLAWLEEFSYVERDKGVFYSDTNVGQAMAREFCDTNEEEGYKWYYTIFDGEFSKYFGGANPSDTEIAKACSQAFAEFVEGETRVFNDAGAKPTSFWKTIELPGLIRNSHVTTIYNMADHTTNPNDHNKDLKNNPTPDPKAYVPGQCGVHVVQYQKNEGPPSAHGLLVTGVNTDYRLDITIADGAGNQIGQTLAEDASGKVPVLFSSALPFPLSATVGLVDSDPISFSYNGHNWDSNSGCSVGGYGGGKRQMDCGFDCYVPEDKDLKARLRL